MTARMLGRYCQGGCACQMCGDGQPDTRWRKRAEAREVEREIAEGAAEYRAEFTEMVVEKYRLDRLLTGSP